MTVTKVRPASVADLLDPTVRDREMIAYWAGLDDLAVAPEVVETSADRVTWLHVDAAEMRGAAVTFQAGGREFTDFAEYPVVLGQVRP